MDKFSGWNNAIADQPVMEPIMGGYSRVNAPYDNAAYAGALDPISELRSIEQDFMNLRQQLDANNNGFYAVSDDYAEEQPIDPVPLYEPEPVVQPAPVIQPAPVYQEAAPVYQTSTPVVAEPVSAVNELPVSEPTVAYQEPVQRQSATLGDSPEDLLLIQIDAFRDKAKQLQSLIQAKEDRVKDLEATVSAKEREITDLQSTLARKQAEADSLVQDVNVQVDRMMQNIKDNMQSLEEKIGAQVANNEEAAAEQSKALQLTLNSMNDSLEVIKADLSEKVHNENVKVYRNIQDLMKEQDHSEEDALDRRDKFSTLKSGNTVSLVFTIINLLLTGCLGAVLLFYMGIF